MAAVHARAGRAVGVARHAVEAEVSRVRGHPGAKAHGGRLRDLPAEVRAELRDDLRRGCGLRAQDVHGRKGRGGAVVVDHGAAARRGKDPGRLAHARLVRDVHGKGQVIDLIVRPAHRVQPLQEEIALGHLVLVVDHGALALGLQNVAQGHGGAERVHVRGQVAHERHALRALQRRFESCDHDSSSPPFFSSVAISRSSDEMCTL